MLRWIAGGVAGAGWLFLLAVFIFGLSKTERFEDTEAVFVVIENQSGRAMRKLEVGANYRTSLRVGALPPGARSKVLRIKNEHARTSRIFVSFEGDYAHVRGVPKQLEPGHYLFTLHPGKSRHELAAEVRTMSED